MIPRLGDGNRLKIGCVIRTSYRLENDSPSRGRKRRWFKSEPQEGDGLENDSPSRGRKPSAVNASLTFFFKRLENDSPSRGRKQRNIGILMNIVFLSLENDSPSRGRKLNIQ